MSNFFALVVFNYIFSNGDAHLKNFSLQQTAAGDYILPPAYDLLNTSIHIDDGDFALQEGLIPQNVQSETHKRTGHPCKDDFIEFGRRIGVLPKKINAIVEIFATEQPIVYELIEHYTVSKGVTRRSCLSKARQTFLTQRVEEAMAEQFDAPTNHITSPFRYFSRADI